MAKGSIKHRRDAETGPRSPDYLVSRAGMLASMILLLSLPGCRCDRTEQSPGSRDRRAASSPASAPASRHTEPPYRITACEREALAEVRAYLGAGGQVDATVNGRTRLHDAARFGRATVVKLLIERGADVNRKDAGCGRTPLLWATRSEVFRLLLEAGADWRAVSGEDQMQPIHRAAQEGASDAVGLLIARGADVGARARRAMTALHFAARGAYPRPFEQEDPEDSSNFGPSSRAKGGHYAAARLLLDRGAPIDAKDTQGRTPLHLSAEAGYPPLVELLLDRGAGVNARDERKQTPLHYAARGQRKYQHHGGHWYGPRRSNLPIARALIAAGAEVDAADKRGRTPLHLAARAGNAALAKHLLAGRADVNALAHDDGGRKCLTPLVEATLGGMEIPGGQPGGHAEVALLLINAGAKANVADRDRRMAPLYWAAARKHLALAVALIKNGADVNAKVESWYRNTPLLRAAENGHPEMVRLLLDAGADSGAVSKDGYTAVGLAAGGGHLAVLKLLVSRGADVKGSLARAVAKDRLEAAKFLLDAGADPNEKSSLDRAALHQLALAGGSPPLAELLIARGADLDAQALERGRSDNVRGATPVKLALLNGHSALARTLARKGAKLDVFAQAGLGRVDELRRVLDKGTPPDQRDAVGRRPLHFAAANNQTAAAGLLLELGAGINAQDTFGRTPLHLAVRLGKTKMVQWLLSRKADPNAPNVAGRTPLHEASSLRVHKGIYAILLKHGADPKIKDKEGRQARRITPGFW